MNDPYDTGIPKYQTAQAIYDGLCELMQAEEMSILSEMFSNVSYNGQDYYYIDKGGELLEKFEAISERGDKMWALNLAIWQIDRRDADGNALEIHDIVFEALSNADLAKRIDFKKLFVEKMLRGDKSDYTAISEGFYAELGDLNRFAYYEMINAWNKVMRTRGIQLTATPYPSFCYALCEKVSNLRLPKETQLIAECRALLTSYDDFMTGLRMNQALYEAQENSYREKVAQLQSSYNELVKQLLLHAKKNGYDLEFSPDLLRELPQSFQYESLHDVIEHSHFIKEVEI